MLVDVKKNNVGFRCTIGLCLSQGKIAGTKKKTSTAPAVSISSPPYPLPLHSPVSQCSPSLTPSLSTLLSPHALLLPPPPSAYQYSRTPGFGEWQPRPSSAGDGRDQQLQNRDQPARPFLLHHGRQNVPDREQDLCALYCCWQVGQGSGVIGQDLCALYCCWQVDQGSGVIGQDLCALYCCWQVGQGSGVRICVLSTAAGRWVRGQGSVVRICVLSTAADRWVRGHWSGSMCSLLLLTGGSGVNGQDLCALYCCWQVGQWSVVRICVLFTAADRWVRGQWSGSVCSLLLLTGGSGVNGQDLWALYCCWQVGQGSMVRICVLSTAADRWVRGQWSGSVSSLLLLTGGSGVNGQDLCALYCCWQVGQGSMVRICVLSTAADRSVRG